MFSNNKKTLQFIQTTLFEFVNFDFSSKYMKSLQYPSIIHGKKCISHLYNAKKVKNKKKIAQLIIVNCIPTPKNTRITFNEERRKKNYS